MNCLLSNRFFESFIEIFNTPKYLNSMFRGLLLTLEISIGATLLGLILGVIVALVKISTGRGVFIRVVRVICNVYVTVVRGTPMALQLFLIAFVIFAVRGFPMEIKAVLAFGINSGAYVAENIRAGIQSVDIGQSEACSALGLSLGTTYKKVIIPQAIKNVIPTIGNELIALVKETSIVYMVGMYDLTSAAYDIGSGSNMANFVVPMTFAAIFYLIIVYGITLIIKSLERRFRASDRNK